MTQVDDKKSPEKKIPSIDSEEDEPFPIDRDKSLEPKTKVDELNQTDKMDREITRFRYITGRKVLYISMSAMGAAVVLDLVVSLIPSANSELITNAFEAFKLITMTVLGYIFGSKSG